MEERESCLSNKFCFSLIFFYFNKVLDLRSTLRIVQRIPITLHPDFPSSYRELKTRCPVHTSTKQDGLDVHVETHLQSSLKSTGQGAEHSSRVSVLKPWIPSLCFYVFEWLRRPPPPYCWDSLSVHNTAVLFMARNRSIPRKLLSTMSCWGSVCRLTHLVPSKCCLAALSSWLLFRENNIISNRKDSRFRNH